MIKNVKIEDIEQICNIYNYYIENTFVTFEEEIINYQEMKNRIDNITKNYPFLVYKKNDEVIGYAYGNIWKQRASYKHTVESTIYLSHKNIKKGIGSMLYSQLIEELKKQNIHNVIGGIALPNEASVRLHEKLGFKKCAHFTQIGNKFNQWIDVGYWEKILD
ncbi:MAG: N-acetyltransferase family protein [Candidatus Sericytochromatia bacterium]